MRSVVVYDSRFSNTERIALAIANAVVTYGRTHVIRIDSMHATELRDVDLLLLGSPTQGWRPTAPMQGFVAEVAASTALQGMTVATFDTRFHRPRWLAGSAATRMAATLRRAGATLAAPPESFFVASTHGPLGKREESRATQWALHLAQQYEAAHPQAVAR